ncbi:MAG TPA: DUF4153 domain-containing protein [Myxococcota bacterium]|nr:DUF4153 domain-containing protein [Myxococcota bacterium]
MDDRLRERLRLAMAGAAWGLAIWLLVDAWPDDHAWRALAVTGLTFLAVTAAVFHFAWTGAHRGRLVAITLATGALYAAVAGWVGWSLPTEGLVSRGDGMRALTWVHASLVTLYVLGPFLQIFQRTGRLHFPYRDLFLHGWNNFFVALVGALFVGSLWAVLMLWGALFHLVGIDVFQDLFEKGWFASPVTGAAVGFGIALGREGERVVATLRGITLAVFRGLLPLVAFVALIFLATLPFTGLGGLWDTNHASQLLLIWVALAILFLNAVYQDGAGDDLPPPAIRRLVEAALLAMTAYVAIAAYGISLRIAQYGLTPQRFWGVLATVVLGAYAFGYAAAVLRRGEPWLRMVRVVNLAVALLVAAIGLLAHTPVLDPIGWSARSQFARLAEGRVTAADFDYGYLRFQLGRAGEDRLEALAALDGHPEIDAIRAGVAEARAAHDYWSWQQRNELALAPAQFTVFPEGGALPPGLIAFARGSDAFRGGPGCDGDAACVAFAVELDGEAAEEWVLGITRWGHAELQAFAVTDAGFEALGTFVSNGGPDAEGLSRSLESLDFGAIEPRHRDLRIGERRYRLVPR